MFKLLLILPCLILMFQPLKAKVEAPNYEFKLDTLEEFMPGKKMTDLEGTFGKGEEVTKNNQVRTVKYKIAKNNYHIQVLLQEKDGIIFDSFFRLPSYFLHDVFLQSLVNKLGKQNSFKNKNEEAFYVWNSTPIRHVYSAACTITCFPIFYSVTQPEANLPSLLEQMKVK